MLGYTFPACDANPGARPSIPLNSGDTFSVIAGDPTYIFGSAGPATTSGAGTLTVDALGIVGAAPRTYFLQYYQTGTTAQQVLFNFGVWTGNYLGQMLGVNWSSNTTTIFSAYASDHNFNSRPNTDPHLVRAVIAYDGNTGLRINVRALSVGGASAGTVTEYLGQNFTTPAQFATPTGSQLYFSSFGSNNTGVNPGTNQGISYLGVIGGSAWADVEALDFLRQPERLWAPRRPAVSPQIVSVASLLGVAYDAPDWAAGQIAVSAALSGGSPDRADQVVASLLARAALSGGAPDLADQVAASLLARAALSGVAVDGADQVLSLLAARAGLSGGAVDVADPVNASLLARAALFGGAPDAADQLAATVLVRAALSGGATDTPDRAMGALAGRAVLSANIFEQPDLTVAVVVAAIRRRIIQVLIS